MEENAVITALTALSQESRLRVFRLLVTAGAAGLPAGRIAEELAITPNTLSFHLSHLKNAGLVAVRREGRSLIYSAEYAHVRAVVDYLTENCCSRQACGNDARALDEGALQKKPGTGQEPAVASPQAGHPNDERAKSGGTSARVRMTR